MNIRPFHVAFPVNDLKETHKFYTEILQCKIGRASEKWIDFDLYGHQITAHHKPSETRRVDGNAVDGKTVPVLHWGVILEWEQWHQLADHVKANSIDFIIEPYIRFKGEIGEQATMFFLDPSGNALEFKSFKHDASIFAS
ncbi:MAG: VOC family protein [Bacteroidota bacterium]